MQLANENIKLSIPYSCLKNIKYNFFCCCCPLKKSYGARFDLEDRRNISFNLTIGSGIWYKKWDLERKN
jgi:hypothetical protein